MATGDNVRSQLDIAAEEGLRYLTKALRGSVDANETSVRSLMGASASILGTWSRNRATESAMAQTEIMRAGIFARELGGDVSDYLTDVPEPKRVFAPGVQAAIVADLAAGRSVPKA